MHVRTIARGTVVAAVVATLGIMNITPAAAGPQPEGRDGQDTAAAQAALRSALQRDLDLTPQQAAQVMARQSRAATLSVTLATRLGASFGGSWFDVKRGKLVVAVTSADRARQARSTEVETTVVKRSKKTLDGVKAELDALAKRDRNKLSAATAWAVDVQRNQVLVTVRTGQRGAVAGLLAKYRDTVRIQESAIKPRLTADYLDGGDGYVVNNSWSCSVGFNVVRNGVGHFLTAGHCGKAGDTAAQNDVPIGPFVESWFPGDDDALVRNDNQGHWIQGPWVFAYTGDPNTVFNIQGYRDSPVGTAICKSGKTTGVTCGVITLRNETVNYDEGTVYQMTRHSACVEKGDSGGANFSSDSTGNYAEGITSGAHLQWDGSRLRCLQAFGQQNLSWYQPVAESIPYYGLTLMTN